MLYKSWDLHPEWNPVIKAFKENKNCEWHCTSNNINKATWKFPICNRFDYCNSLDSNREKCKSDINNIITFSI